MIRTRVVEGIIIKQRDFGEADRLYGVFTKQMGKITVLGRGVRRIRSRRGGNLDVLNNVILTLAQGQSMYLVTEAQTINAFSAIKENLSKVFYGYYICELIDGLTAEQEVSLDVFYLLKQILSLFEEHPRRIYVLLFEVKLLSTLGFFSAQEIRTKNADVIALAHDISVQSVQRLVQNDYPDGAVHELSAIVRNQIEGVLEHDLKSPQIMGQLKQIMKQMEQ